MKSGSLQDFASLPDDAQISVKKVAVLLDAGVSTIWARVKRDEFPRPRKFGRSTRWNVGEIRRHLANAGHEHDPA